jgi:hypothetical protein
MGDIRITRGSPTDEELAALLAVLAALGGGASETVRPQALRRAPWVGAGCAGGARSWAARMRW